MLSYLRRLRILKNDGGAVAIEFAIVGPLFLLMTLSLVVNGLVFFAGQHWEQTLSQLTKDVYEGRPVDGCLTVTVGEGVNAFERTTYTSDCLSGAMCERAVFLFTAMGDCASRASFDLRVVDEEVVENQGTGWTVPDIMTAGALNAGAFTSDNDAIKEGRVFILRAAFRYPSFLDFGPDHAWLNDGDRVFLGIRVIRFRNLSTEIEYL